MTGVKEWAMADRPSDGYREADHYGRTIQRLGAERLRLLGALRAVVTSLGQCSIGNHCGHLREAQDAAESALGKTYAELIRE
jgi:hypothetical protein